MNLFAFTSSRPVPAKELPLGRGHSPGSWGTVPKGRPGQTCGTPGPVPRAQTQHAGRRHRNGTEIRNLGFVKSIQ